MPYFRKNTLFIEKSKSGILRVFESASQILKVQSIWLSEAIRILCALTGCCTLVLRACLLDSLDYSPMNCPRWRRAVLPSWWRRIDFAADSSFAVHCTGDQSCSGCPSECPCSHLPAPRCCLLCTAIPVLSCSLQAADAWVRTPPSVSYTHLTLPTICSV